MMRSRIGKSGITLICAAVLAGSLVGCREDEQSRVLIYDKGTYAGKADTQLSAASLQALRDRMRYQGGTDSFGGPGGGGGGGSSGSTGSGTSSAPDVRPPGMPIDKLRTRGQNQRFN
jgi:hypothetical protein